MAKVYVSSTIADLKRERRAVMDWLVAAGHQPVHSYLPNSDTVRDSCLNDVDRCDLYVLIAGHRYGFRPAEDNPEGLSITHLEFRRACQSGIPRIAFLRTSIPDVSLSDLADPSRLARVSAFRDELTGAVRAAEFSDQESLIQGLSTGIQAELGTQPGRAAGPVLRLAPRPALLAGREQLLDELSARLAGGEGAGPRVVVLSGLGGAGKTSVAVEYAHRYLPEVEVAWQFPAEDATVLAAGFGELAAQLGERGLTDARDPVASVHAVLARFPAPWLLIFDNAADLASVAEFLPPAGPGRVLVTSRNPAWPGQPLHVPMLDPDVATDFLVTRTGDPDRQAARDLADELGGLPLALEQTAAYIQAIGGTLGGYLALFQQRRAELLDRGEPTGYRGTVASTWALAFDRLQQNAPAAVGLLRLLAFCAPEAIPLRLLLRPRPGLAGRLGNKVAPALVPLLEDPLAAGDAIGALRRYSLVIPAADGSVSVHRLVQAITVAQMPAELAVAWREAASAVIEAALPADPRSPDSWAMFASLVSHVQAAPTDNSSGMWRVASYLGYSGSYAAAKDLQQRVLDTQVRVSGPEHPDTLRGRVHLARWTGEAGDAAGARDQFAALLPVCERVLGAEHSYTLAARAGLALWTGEAGDAAGARDQFAALLPDEERVLGAEHSYTLAARGNLARWTGEAGDAAGARDQFAALLPVQQEVLGAKEPQTLTTAANLAYWTGQAGDAVGARDQFAALLPVVERVVGAEEPRSLRARANLARWTGEAGDAVGARDQFAALLPVQQRVLGAENPYTLRTCANLAWWTGEAGDAAGARDQFAALLPVQQRVLGANHPRTLRARGNRAHWTGEAGDAAGARDQFAALLPDEERVLGAEHPRTLSARGRLARWIGEAADEAGARDRLAALLPVQVRVLGAKHPRTLTTHGNLAHWTGQAGDAAGARDQFAALLPACERALGPEHPSTLRTRANLARWTGEAGDAAGARGQYAALLSVQQRVFGAEHPYTLRTRVNLGYWTREAGDAAGARDQ